MNLIEESFKRLYPDKEFNYLAKIKYSGRFKSFNANIRLRLNNLTLNLSKDWKDIDKEIKIGLIQELLIKLFKTKKHTKNMDMYNSFIKGLHKYVPKTHSDPLLDSSFYRVNEKYFSGLLERPNLKFGKKTFTKLGSYEYASDTVTISKALEHDLELVDYVMYHELLHKKHQFKSKNGRSYHHTKDFRKKEKEFPNANLLEKRLSRLKVKNFFKLI
jgi:predicted metal-dependent hydrolase